MISSEAPGNMLAHFFGRPPFPILFPCACNMMNRHTAPFGRCDFLCGRTGKRLFYLPENPGVAESSPADHQAVAAGLPPHTNRIMRCADIAVADHRDLYSLFYQRNA